MANKYYHVKESCNFCGGENDIVKITDSMEGRIHECETKCLDCGEIDYWATGFFESSQNIEGKCKKY